MEKSEKRLSKRLKVNLPVTFDYLGPKRHFGETITRDISPTGVRMNMEAFFAPEASFLLKVSLPEVNRVIEATANVIWSQRISYSDLYQAGFEFKEINPVFKNWLEEYVIVSDALNRQI